MTEIQPQPCALYRHFDDLGTLLYVGISQDPAARSAGHIRSSEWVQFARRGSVEWFPSTAHAAMAEVMAIRSEGPVFNRVHSVGNPDARIAEYYERCRIELEPTQEPRPEPVIEAPGEILSLSQAAERLWVPLKAMRNARDRDASFPDALEPLRPGRASRYSLDDLKAWAVGRGYSSVVGIGAWPHLEGETGS